MLERVDGVDRPSQLRGHLGRRVAGDEPQQHHVALILRQRREGVLERLEPLAGLRLGDRAGRVHLGERHRALRSKMIERSVSGDPQQPSREGVAPAR